MNYDFQKDIILPYLYSLKNNILVTLVQLLSIIIFSFSTFKIFKNERYIATIILATLEIIFMNNLSSAIYITAISLAILAVENLDVTYYAAYYRKKNIVLITLSEIILTYLFITNYNFVFFYLLFIIYLIKKMTLKSAIKASFAGMFISLGMLILSFYINLPFVDTKNILDSNLLNIYVLIQVTLIVLA